MRFTKFLAGPGEALLSDPGSRLNVTVAVLFHRRVADTDCVLMAKRTGTSYPGYYACPGGTLEPGEGVYAAGVREVREETGLEIQESDFFGMAFRDAWRDAPHAPGGKRHYVIVYLHVNLPEGQEPRNMEPDKAEDWFWVPADRLPEPNFAPNPKPEMARCDDKHRGLRAGDYAVYSEPPGIFCVVKIENIQRDDRLLTYRLQPLAMLEGHTSPTVRIDQGFTVSEDEANGCYGVWHLRSFEAWAASGPALRIESARLKRETE